MSTRNMVRVIEATLDETPMDCEDHDRVHLWLVAPAWSYRRAFLVQGTPFMAAAGYVDPELYSEEQVYDLIGERFFAEFDLPTTEADTGERIEISKVEPAPDADLGRFRDPAPYTEPYLRDERETYIKNLLDDSWLKGNLQRQRAYVHDPIYSHDIKLVLSMMIALDESMARAGLGPNRRDEVLRLTFAGGPYGVLLFPPDVREAIVRMEKNPFVTLKKRAQQRSDQR